MECMHLVERPSVVPPLPPLSILSLAHRSAGAAHAPAAARPQSPSRKLFTATWGGGVEREHSPHVRTHRVGPVPCVDGGC